MQELKDIADVEAFAHNQAGRNLQVGDAVSWPYSAQGLLETIAIIKLGAPQMYGRIMGFSGAEFEGSQAIIHVMTPGGSEVQCGRAYIEQIDDDHPELLKWEQVQRDNGNPVYQDRLPCPTMTSS